MSRILVGIFSLISAFTLAGCGLGVPPIQEVGYTADVKGELEYRIKEKIFCELVRALKEVNNGSVAYGRPKSEDTHPIPYSNGVQMQISLTVEETTSLNPTGSINNPLEQGFSRGSDIPRSFSLVASGKLSSTATRTDTSYSYYNIGKISKPGANMWCAARDQDKPEQQLDKDSSSLLLKSDLGIKSYLDKAVVRQYNTLHSSIKPDTVDAKTDIYSYDVKFVVVTSGGIDPTVKLVNVSAGGAATPLLAAGRTRTHNLVLTFGPGGPTAASPEALQAHFTPQIVQALQQNAAMAR